MKKILNYLLFICLMAPFLGLSAETFQAPFTEAKWRVESSPILCTLKQRIPDYGFVEFSQQGGGHFHVTFTTRRQPAAPGSVTFEVAEAAWQNKEDREFVTAIPVEANQNTFTLKDKLAKQIYTHIDEGRVPAIRYRSQHIRGEISVLMSTIHFKTARAEFQSCVENLHPDSYEDIRHLTVYFKLEKAELSATAKTALMRIADYVKLDPSIKRINVSAHTDNHGRRKLNQELSDKRAMAVRKYLTETCELPEQLVITSSHLELKPIATNTTQMGRAYNRRAEIEVLR
jgi:outer membrane protein OmpA-like peptidoglycan-associated protein